MTDGRTAAHASGLRDHPLYLAVQRLAVDLSALFRSGDLVMVVPQRGIPQLFERIEANFAEWNARFSAFDYQSSSRIGCAAREQGGDIVDALHKADEERYRDKK
jgi:hypothetical protein